MVSKENGESSIGHFYLSDICFCPSLVVLSANTASVVYVFPIGFGLYSYPFVQWCRNTGVFMIDRGRVPLRFMFLLLRNRTIQD